MTRLSLTIMAHPKRERWIPDLRARLGNPQVVWDRENDRWETGRRSLLAFDPEATHHLVVQDDAIVCRDLKAGLEKALRHVPPGHPVALYTGRVRPRAPQVSRAVKIAEQKRRSWVVMDGPLWGVGIVLPTKDIEAVVAFGDAHPHIANYDIRISQFYKEHNRKCYYTLPSLVDHRVDGNPSLVPGRTGKGRRAHRFIGEDASALDVDWTRV